MRLPPLAGAPILISTQPHLTAHRGKLLSASLERGTPVHAACFIRERRIVLESALFTSPRMLRLILLHEIFHFVWTRLPNSARSHFAGMLRMERQRGAIGELGESAEIKKALVCAAGDHFPPSLWRDYACESFCDTAAWLYSGIAQHGAFRLAARWRNRRKAWFHNAIEGAWNC